MIDLTILAFSIHFSNEVSLEILITVFIFFAGYILNAVLAAIRKSRERVLIKNTFILWMDKMIQSLNSYASNMQSLAYEIKKSDSFQPASFTQQLIPFEQFSAYSLDQLTEVFIFKLKPYSKHELYSGPLALYAFLSETKKVAAIQDRAKEDYYEYYQEFKRLSNEFFEYIDCFSDNVSRNFQDPKITKNEKYIYCKINEIMVTCRPQKKDAMEVGISKFKQAYLDILAELKPSIYDSERVKMTYELSRSVWKVTIQLAGLKVYGNRFESMAGQLQACRECLNSVEQYWLRSKIINWYSFRNLSYRADGNTEVLS